MVNSICEILKCFNQNDVTYNHSTSFNYANARYYFVNTGSSDQPNYQNILSIQLTVHRRILGLQLWEIIWILKIMTVQNIKLHWSATIIWATKC
jgi:hypothetical protein